MLERVLQFSLSHRSLVLVVATTLMVGGMIRATDMPVDVFPDLTAPRVAVVTESSGMAPEEVERLVTFPIETAVNGAAGLRRVRSASTPGISIVWAEFDWDTTTIIARQRITERLQGVSDILPPEAGVPLLAPASSVMGEIMFVGMTSTVQTPRALRRIAEVQVRRRILGVQGISQVVPIGGQVKQYHVLVEPLRLEAYGLTLNEVVGAVEGGSLNAPGGYVVDGGQESVVRVLGRSHNITELQQLVIALRDGVGVRLQDVATVKEGAAPSRGTASVNAEPAVLLSIVKQPDADTLNTTRRVDEALDLLEKELEEQGVNLHRTIFRQQDFIDTAIANAFSVLRDGAFLVVAVLMLFLWSVRPTVISVVAIPLSLMSAVWVLSILGLRLDTMTLGGLAIAMGEVVDDAIVDVENVARRLRERRMQPVMERPPVITTVFDASMEIRSAIASATFLLLLVFVPLLFLDGLEGRLLQPLAVAYLAAIFASLVVAITVTPVLCSFLLDADAEKQQGREPPLLAWIGKVYVPILESSVRNPTTVLSGVCVVVLMGLVAFTGLGRSFLPEFNEGSITINMVLAPGTALDESDALAKMAENVLLKDPGVRSVARRTGRAERDEHAIGVETTEIEVAISQDDPRDREQLFADIRQRLAAVPAQFNLGQPISHRVEHMISGTRSAFSVKLFGEDLRAMRRVAEQIRSVMEDVEGVVDLGVEQIVNIPQLVIDVDAQAAAAYGLSTGAAAKSVGTAMWGRRATQIYEGGATTDVIVKYPSENVTDLNAVKRVLIPTPSGATVPISALAEVSKSSGPNYILRENVARRLVVTSNVSGGDTLGVFEAVKERVGKSVKLPAGIRIEYDGQFKREEATNSRLIWLGLLVVVGIGFIITKTLGSVRRSLIVLVNLPLALAGGVVGVYLAGGVLSVATTIGFITLFGIASRNGILLATRARDLELAGLECEPAVCQAAQERLAPILMTAVTAGLALLPLALALGEPGTEIQAPMALVILTGLCTSTVLNMLVVPALLAQDKKQTSAV